MHSYRIGDQNATHEIHNERNEVDLKKRSSFMCWSTIALLYIAVLATSCASVKGRESHMTPAQVPISTTAPHSPTVTIVMPTVTKPEQSRIDTEITPKPTTTEELPPTPNPKMLEFYSSHVLAYATPQRIVIINLQGEVVNEIELDKYNISPFRLDWNEIRCQLIAWVTTGEEIKLIGMDLNDNVMDVIHTIEREKNETAPELSPGANYVSVVIWSGEMFRDSAEYQDIAVYPVNEPNPILLSKHGGVWKYGGEWSPAGERIAYTDYDDNGILQLYVSSNENLSHQTQLTHFEDTDLKPGPVSWSPDNDKIALVTYHEDGDLDFWILDLNGHKPVQIALPDSIYGIYDRIYWSSGVDTVVIEAESLDERAGLYWINIDQAKISHVLDEYKAVSKNSLIDSINLLFPISTDASVVGFVDGGVNLYKYNTQNGIIEHYFDIPADAFLQDIIPMSLDDQSECHY